MMLVPALPDVRGWADTNHHHHVDCQAHRRGVYESWHHPNHRHPQVLYTISCVQPGLCADVVQGEAGADHHHHADCQAHRSGVYESFDEVQDVIPCAPPGLCARGEVQQLHHHEVRG